jgi:hypothetical protein
VLLLFQSCEGLNSLVSATKDDSVSSELFKDVEITIEGNITSVDTDEALEGMTVAVLEYSGSDVVVVTLGSATTDSSGDYSIDETMVLKVDEYEYRLSVSDSNEKYYTNDSTILYVLRDTDLTGYDVQLVPKNPISNTTVQGVVKSGISRTTGVAGVSIILTDVYDSSQIFTTTTLEEDNSTETLEAGTYSVEVPVSSYRITFDGSALDTQYISEYSDEVLKNAAVNNLGTQFIVPQIPDGEFRIVLQWQNSGGTEYDLNTMLDLFRPDFQVINSAGPNADKVQINSSFSLNPGTGFAEESSYWPISVVPSPERVIIDYYSPEPPGATDPSTRLMVGGNSVIEIDRDETQESPIEIITIRQENPLTSYPSNMLYYYNYADGGDINEHYPIGVLNMVVNLNKDSGENINIYDSNATVKLYAGSQFQGSFHVGSFYPKLGESNVISWDVLFLEMGYTNQHPTDSTEIYIRAVPFVSVSSQTSPWDQPAFISQALYDTDGSGNITGTHNM